MRFLSGSVTFHSILLEHTHASIMAEICVGLPAVIFEMVQQDSFRIPSLGDESKLRRAGRAPEEMMTCV